MPFGLVWNILNLINPFKTIYALTLPISKLLRFLPLLCVFLLFYHVDHFQTNFNVLPSSTLLYFSTSFYPFFKKRAINFQFSSIFLALSSFSTPFQKLMVFFWFFFDIAWPLFCLLRPPRLPIESCTLHSWTQDSGQREVSNNIMKIGIGWVFDPFSIV